MADQRNAPPLPAEYDPNADPKKYDYSYADPKSDRITVAGNPVASMPDWMTKNLSPTNALPWQQYLNNDVVKMGAQIGEDAQDPGKFLNYGMSGTAPKLGAVSSLGGNSAMNSALSNKYQGILGNKMSSFQNKQNANLPTEQSQQMLKSADVFANAQKIAMNNYQEQQAYEDKRRQISDQYWNAKAAASASTLTSILSMVGTVGGAIIGGPAGAAAGGAIGAGAGAAASSV